MSPAAGSRRQCFHLEDFGGLKGMEEGDAKRKGGKLSKLSFGGFFRSVFF